MVKVGYKQTEVGEIPNDWEVKVLDDVVDFLDGQRKPIKASERAKMQGIYPYYGASGIVDYVNDYLFDEQLILLGEDGENILSRNTRLAFQVNGKIWVNNHSHVLRAKAGNDTGFITEYLESLDYAEYNSGTAQPKLNKKTCKNIPIASPSHKEQQLIAEALSDVDGLIAGLDKLIAKKRAVKQAAMQQLLKGKTRLPGFGNGRGYKQTEVGDIPQDWDIETVGNLALITTGSRNTQDKKDDGRFPFFVRSQTVEYIDSYSFDGEAVLTAGDGVGTGKVFHYINGKFDYHQRVYKISDFKPEIHGFYFYKYFSEHFYDRIMSMTAKSSVDSVRMEMIANMLIPLPSPDEQKAIAEILSDIDAEITALEARRAKTQAIKQGMMQELLTGRTRLL